MSEPFNLAKPGRTIHVGVILAKGVTEILDVAPVDLIHSVSHSFIDRLPDTLVPPELKAQALDTEFHWVSEAGTCSPSNLTSSISLMVTDSFETSPPLDIVLMGASPGYEPSEAELSFIRKSFDNCSAFITVCTAIEFALKAGILNGKTATAPRFMLDTVRTQAPDTNWVERRWVRDGKLWSSGTLLNGLDLVSAFIQETWPSGQGTLVDLIMKVGAWPNRDPEYKDVSWKD